MPLHNPRNTLVADYEHVVENDPVFDTKAEGWADAWQRFLESGDWKPLPRSGEPSVFILRHIRGDAKVKLEELLASAPFRALYLAARYALVSCREVTIGGAAFIPRMDRDPDVGALWVAGDDMATLYDAFPKAVTSIGARAVGRLNADPP
jgi:hypothetical protein